MLIKSHDSNNTSVNQSIDDRKFPKEKFKFKKNQILEIKKEIPNEKS